MFQPRSIVSSVATLTKMAAAVNRTVIGRRPVVDQIVFAILTKNHVLLEGPPGVAKSFLASTVFNSITGGSYFKVQCTRKMTEDYLLGPLDMARFRNEGDYIHKVEGYLPTSHFAFLDEFMDLSSGALRSLLGILNEREFVRGPQAVKCPLITAIACTNFSGNGEDEKSYEAVKDRFLFKAKVLSLTRKDDRRAMFNKPPEPVCMTLAEIRRLIQAVQEVTVPEAVLDGYLRLCEGLTITDRSCKKGLEVVKAAAVRAGRQVASIEDIMAVETCFSSPGDPASEQKFATAAKGLKDLAQSAELRVKLMALGTRAHQLRSLLDASESYDAAATATAYEVREAMAAADHLMRNLTGTPYSKSLDAIRATLAQCINRADVLYAKGAKP